MACGALSGDALLPMAIVQSVSPQHDVLRMRSFGTGGASDLIAAAAGAASAAARVAGAAARATGGDSYLPSGFGLASVFGLSAEVSSRFIPDDDPCMVWRRVMYCAPHVKIPGYLFISANLLHFQPDSGHEELREFGPEDYDVLVETRDILQCGAVTVPIEAPFGEVEPNPRARTRSAFFLQLQVRTLGGQAFCPAEDAANAWCVVFRLRSRDELHDTAKQLLAVLETARQEAPPRSHVNRTSVPFSSLDCAAEAEALWRQEMARRARAVDSGSPTACSSGSPGSAGTSSRGGGDSPARVFTHLEQVVLHPGNVDEPILTQSLAEQLFDYLPISVRAPGATDWLLCYTPKEHGTSLSTLYRRAADSEMTLLVVQDAEGNVLGGFAPQAWEQRGRFYGSGESFVFSFRRPLGGGEEELQVFTWTSQNSYFMYSDADLLAMGGGDGHYAIAISHDLLRGHSAPTPTFGNPCLASSEEFVVRDLELWAFEPVS